MGEKASTIKEGFKRALEVGEHIHFGWWLLKDVLFVLVPPAVLWIAHAAGWLAGEAAPFWRLFVLTTPLTLTVALSVIIVVWTYKWGLPRFLPVVLIAGLILGSAYLSQLSAIGTAPEWGQLLAEFKRLGLREPLQFVEYAATAYYKLYHAVAFIASVVTGGLLGALVAKKIVR